MRQKPVKRFVALPAAGLLLSVLCKAQTTVAGDPPGATVVIPGKEYKRSGYHNFFWGKHYRKEWDTPVTVPDFFLDTAKGGLVPVQKGGGRQSNTLRLKDKNGKEYVLRSIDKDFGRALPEEMRGTFLARIAKDQVSIGHPFSALTIAPMAEAAGIYHTNPVIVFVPYQRALKGFNQEFGNQLYLFEERPDDNQEDAPNFGNAEKVVGTEKMMEHVFNDHDYRVDQEEFVRARLFDMFIGDWGRHPDNWRWAAFKNGEYTLYRPIPRDRDQAYTKIDGLYPSLAGSIPHFKQLQGFHKNIKKIGDWNMPGHPLDEKYLNEPDRQTWIMQAQQLQQVLTDSLITTSIRRMPPELFAISGNEIIEKLKSRRDHLVDFANRYYTFLARKVDLAGTGKRDMFVIERLPAGETLVCIYRIDKDGDVEDAPYYVRKFNTKDTKQLRIYPLDKQDVVNVKGEERHGVKIRIIGDGDSVVFAGKKAHNEINVYEGMQYEYDTAHKKKFDFSLRPFFTAQPYKVYDTDPLKLFPRTGLKVGAGITYTTQPWQKDKYEDVHHISAYYGFLRGAFNVGYAGRFGHLFGNWDLLLKARLDAPSVENYFGTGNNTVIGNPTTNYYRTFSTRVYAGAGITRDFNGRHHVEATVYYHGISFKQSNDHFIGESTNLVDPSVFGQNNFAGIEAGYSYLHVNNPVYPTKGFSWVSGTGYTVNLQAMGESFITANAAAAVYLPLSRQFSVAVRAGGAALSGETDFFNLNKIGGGGNGEIRAYERERFYGKETAYFNGDLRWLFNTHNFLFNGKAGLLTFYDIGRVWMPGESSTLWHDGYGFGIVLVPYNKFALTGLYGISPEGNNLHFKVGLLF